MPMPLSSTHDLFVFCFRIIMKVLSSTAFEREKLYLNLCHILFNAATVCLRFPMYLKTLTAAQEYRTIFIRRTRIVRKGRLHVTSFIFKYKTPTTYPLYETTRHFLLINKGRLWVPSALRAIHLYVQSGYNLFINFDWMQILNNYIMLQCYKIEFSIRPKFSYKVERFTLDLGLGIVALKVVNALILTLFKIWNYGGGCFLVPTEWRWVHFLKENKVFILLMAHSLTFLSQILHLPEWPDLWKI